MNEVVAVTFLKRYLIPRLIQYVLVIWLGITAVFLIPRLTPNDPIMRMIGEMRARGSTMEPGTMDDIITDLTEMYGLEGSWLDQYWAFWGRLFHADFGVSFFQFPTRVNQTDCHRHALDFGTLAEHDCHHVDIREYHWRVSRLPLAEALVAYP